MFFTVTLYFALTIFAAGLLYKTSKWFSCQIGGVFKEVSFSVRDRAYAALKGMISVFFSKKCFTLINVFILDVVLQRKLLRQSRFRWAVHMSIFIAMSFLILLHAMDDIVTASLFTDYYSTLNPFFFLKNLFGAMVLIGLIFAACRRIFSKHPRRFSSAMDYNIIILIGLIIVSGVLLEAVEIFSHNEFKRMVTDYSGLDLEQDAEEIQGLECYWVDAFGMVSPNARKPFDPEILEQGLESHENYCAQCHSSAQWAFASYGLSRVFSPLALALDRIDASAILWHFHYLVSLLTLACLPFSKMFHFLAAPLCFLANAVMDKASDPANVATRQVMELDACVHCGICNERCTNAGAFGAIENAHIMPSEKMSALKMLASGKQLTKIEMRNVQNGFFFCTNCRHCTDNCPVGINLQALWLSARDAFLRSGFPEFFLLSPLSIHRAIRRIETRSILFRNPLILLKQIMRDEFEKYAANSNGTALKLADLDPEPRKKLLLSLQGHTSTTCFACMTCSSVCPVVANYDNPKEKLGLLPHQVIRSANLGLLEMAFGSNMLWSCLGCYECQDCCPQGVCITDVFYELKNMAITHFEEKARL